MFFHRQFIFKGMDFLEGQSVFNGDGDLCSDAVEKLGIAIVEGVKAAAGEIQRAVCAAFADQGHAADRSKAFFAQDTDKFSWKLIQLRAMKYEAFCGAHATARRRFPDGC